jgi:hypothetical protein
MTAEQTLASGLADFREYREPNKSELVTAWVNRFFGVKCLLRSKISLVYFPCSFS